MQLQYYCVCSVCMHFYCSDDLKMVDCAVVTSRLTLRRRFVRFAFVSIGAQYICTYIHMMYTQHSLSSIEYLVIRELDLYVNSNFQSTRAIEIHVSPLVACCALTQTGVCQSVISVMLLCLSSLPMQRTYLVFTFRPAIKFNRSMPCIYVFLISELVHAIQQPYYIKPPQIGVIC